MAKVLVVEDEHSLAEVLTMLLSLEGFEVTVAVNGKDALDQLDVVSQHVVPIEAQAGDGRAVRDG